MRDVSIRKVAKRHYVVYINGSPVYEGMNPKFCKTYLRDNKKEYLRKGSEPSSEAPRGSERAF